MTNKTDRNDARGIAQVMRTGWFRAVHVKSTESHELKTLLTGRKLLVNKLLDVRTHPTICQLMLAGTWCHILDAIRPGKSASG